MTRGAQLDMSPGRGRPPCLPPVYDCDGDGAKAGAGTGACPYRAVAA